MTKVLMIIDPQKDFIDSPDFKGALAVPGAYEDMLRLTDYINNNNFDSIVLTLDTHEKLDIAHSSWWVNEKGEHPTPFTVITLEDVSTNKWFATHENMRDYSAQYVKELNNLNKFSLVVWPDHCIANSEGNKVDSTLATALKNWEDRNQTKINYVIKGTNPQTEHYSGLKAEVVLPDAPETALNTNLINLLDTFDEIQIAGEASSHCVANTVIDLLENLSVENRSKVTLLKDCMKPVPGFEDQEKILFNKIESLGANFATTKSVRPKFN